MGIMDNTGDNVPRVPAEGGAASLHYTPHLITAVDLEDARTALGARLCLCANHLGRLHGVRVTGVLGVFVLSNRHEA